MWQLGRWVRQEHAWLGSAEALAVRGALSWLKGQHYNNVRVEMDAKQLIDHFSNENITPYGLLIQDISALLYQFSNVCIRFIKRSANQVAHLLARDASTVLGARFWLIPAPRLFLRLFVTTL